MPRLRSGIWEWEGEEMTKIIRWLIKKFLPGYHLAKDPARGTKQKKKENEEDTLITAIKQAPKITNKVLFREAETCGICGGVYLSLYPLRMCGDHEGLERI